MVNGKKGGKGITLLIHKIYKHFIGVNPRAPVGVGISVIANIRLIIHWLLRKPKWRSRVEIWFHSALECHNVDANRDILLSIQNIYEHFRLKFKYTEGHCIVQICHWCGKCLAYHVKAFGIIQVKFDRKSFNFTAAGDEDVYFDSINVLMDFKYEGQKWLTILWYGIESVH